MNKTSSIIEEIENAPLFIVVAKGGNRKETVEAAYDFYRVVEQKTEKFSMDMKPMEALDFISFIWSVKWAYIKFNEKLMHSIGLGETVIGPARTSDLIASPTEIALSFFNSTFAILNFNSITEDCESFVKWRLKENV